MTNYNKFIQELPTIATNRVTLDTSLPMALEVDEVNKSYETFQISLRQLESILTPPVNAENVIALFTNDLLLSNISFNLIDNLILANYDETKLNTLADIVDSIQVLLGDIVNSLTNQDTNELYIIYDELRRIQNQLNVLSFNITSLQQEVNLVKQNLATTNNAVTTIQGQITTINNDITTINNFLTNDGNSYNSKILSFPERRFLNIPISTSSNYLNWVANYSVTLDKFVSKIFINVQCKTASEGIYASTIDIYNVQSIFDQLPSVKKDSAILEVQFVLFADINGKMPLSYFLTNKTFNFYGFNNKNQLLFKPQLNVNLFLAEAPVKTYSFSVFFNSAGLMRHNANDTRDFLTLDEQYLLSDSINYTISENGTSLYVRFQDNPSNVSNIFSLLGRNIVNIDKIYLDIKSIGLNDIIFKFAFPFHKIKATSVIFYFTENNIQKGSVIIPTTLGEAHVEILYKVRTNALQYIVRDNQYLLSSSSNLNIDFSKQNTDQDLSFVIQEHSETLFLNITLKPYNYNGFFYPTHNNIISFHIDSVVGKLNLLKKIILNINTGDVGGFFRYGGFQFSTEAIPLNFNYVGSDTSFSLVCIGANDLITGLSNDVAIFSNYTLELINNCFVLTSSKASDDISFEKIRKNENQKILQAMSSRLFDTTIFFPLAIISNRDSLNFDAFNVANDYYTGSTIPAYLPPRQNEWVWNAYLKLSILFDPFQNIQSLSKNYFIQQKVHLIDYFVLNGVVKQRVNDPSTYNFDDKQSRTLLIIINNLTPLPRDFYFSLDVTMGVRFTGTTTFFIRVVNTDEEGILTDINPSLQILPNSNYGVAYLSSETNYVFETSMSVTKSPLNAISFFEEKINFALRLSSDFSKCEEIPYEASIFASLNDLSNYTTLAEVQALVADIVSGGTIDLTAYATQTDLANSQNAIENYVNNNFANTPYIDNAVYFLQNQINIANNEISSIRNDVSLSNQNINILQNDVIALTSNLQDNYYTKVISDNKYAYKTDLTPIDTNIFNIQNNISDLQNTTIQTNTDIDNIILQANKIRPLPQSPQTISHGTDAVCMISSTINTYAHKIFPITINDVVDTILNQKIIMQFAGDLIVYPSGKKLNNNSLTAEIFIECDGDIPQFTIEISTEVRLTPVALKTQVIQGTKGARKYIIKCIYISDAGLSDDEKYFIDVKATDFAFTNFATQENLQNYYTSEIIDEKFNDILENLDKGNYLKAEHIVNLTDKQYDTTAILDYGSSQDTIVVKSNNKNIFFNEVYADWDIEVNSLETTIATAQTGSMPTSILATPPEHVFMLNDGEDLELLGCTFASMRWNDFFTNSAPAGTGTFGTSPSNYQGVFSVIFDYSNIEKDDLIKVSLQNLIIRLGIVRVTTANYPGTTGTTYVYRNPDCFFHIKIRKDGIDKIIASLPTYNYKVDTLANRIKAVNIRYDAFEFFINSSGFRIGNYFEGNNFGDYDNANYLLQNTSSLFSGLNTYTPSVTITPDWNNQTICIPLISKCLNYQASSSATLNIILLTNASIEEEIICKIQFYLSGLTLNQVIRVYQNSIVTANLRVTLIVDTFVKPNYIELNDCVITKTTFKYKSYYKIINQSFYDWDYSLFQLALFNKTTAILTTAEINAIKAVPQAPRNFIIPDTANECIVDNLKFYYIRSYLRSTNGEVSYAYGSLANSTYVKFSTLSTTPILLTIKSMTLFRGCPYISSTLFPNNIGLTTTQRASYPDSDTLYFYIDNTLIGQITTQNNFVYSKTLSKKFEFLPFLMNKKIYIEKLDPTIYAGSFYKLPISFKDTKLISTSVTINDLSLLLNFNAFVTLMQNSTLLNNSALGDIYIYLPVNSDYSNSANEFLFTYNTNRKTAYGFFFRIRPKNLNNTFADSLIQFYFPAEMSLLFVKNTTTDNDIPSQFRGCMFASSYVFASDIAEGKKVYFFTAPLISTTISIYPADFFNFFNDSVIYYVCKEKSTPFAYFKSSFLSTGATYKQIKFSMRMLVQPSTYNTQLHYYEFQSSTSNPVIAPSFASYSLSKRTELSFSMLVPN
jgi:hypothetical protein